MTSSLQKGTVYGPFEVGSNYTLYKLIDIANEGAYSAKASHILLKADASDSSKASAKAKAQDVLNKIKAGASFEEMARTYGSDGTAGNGGDLGWFSEGRMVKPFEEAVFKQNSRGLIPTLVQTDFGYHIVKVTEPKTNLKYKVVAIQKNIVAGDETREALYAKAAQFKSEATDNSKFDTLAIKQGLDKREATNIAKNGNSVNEMQEAREIVKWSYSDERKVGEISDVYDLNDRYLVAILTKISTEGNATVADVKDQLTSDLRKNKKAEQIIKNLGEGTLEQMQKKYGANAVVNTNPELLLNSSTIAEIGYDPAAVGKAFGLKTGKQSKPFQAESGVAVLKMLKFTESAPMDKKMDVAPLKTTISSRSQGRDQYNISEAIKELARIKDNRVRLF
jgi:peptidyl-prolyl cis-trans isomerase D